MSEWLLIVAGSYVLGDMQKESPVKRLGLIFGSPGRTRTIDKVVNSHSLYRLSYRGMMDGLI